MAAPVERDLLATITSIATIASPIALLLLGGLGWMVRQTLEKSRAKEIGQQARIRELEDKLRDDRVATYNAILAPFFLIFVSDSTFESDKKYRGKNKAELAIAQMMTVEYRRPATCWNRDLKHQHLSCGVLTRSANNRYITRH